MSNYEIVRFAPQYMFRLSDMERVRQTVQGETAKNERRNVEVIYIFGPPGTGKTRAVMEQYGYGNVFRVTDYERGCFDAYSGQDVVLFDEFVGGLRITDMNNYLDIYPVCLPCRYMNKWAHYTKAYIISNLPLEFQYPNIQTEKPDIWKALLRRIKKVVHYTGQNNFDEYTVEEYFAPPVTNADWQEVPATGDLPF